MPAQPKGSMHTSAPRLAPPVSLSEGAAIIFRNLVASVDPTHFSPVDMPLLMQYASSADMAAKAQAEIDTNGAVIDGKASPWVSVVEKAQRSCVALAARLRVCPQSRFDRLVAGANSRSQPNTERPWHYEGVPDPAERFFTREKK